ncbi:MAG: polyprenyl synthetase family protein [Pseudobdellovibrio sp.]
MSLQMSTLQKEFEVKFLNFSEDYFLKLKTHLPEVSILWESVQYSLNSGGKRFRPFLSYLVSLAKKHDSQIKLDEIIPFSLAVEMIHTYSLIHDDLPCMDNDDYRRGQPTNHKVYGEDIALLAGDTLLTLSFSLVAEAYRDRSDCAVKLIQLLTQNAGPLGMIGGQVLDIKSAQGITAIQIKKMHNLKTGALIEASVIGAALICNYNADEISNFSSYGKALGLAFQIKDDILDADDRDQDYKNFVSLIGLEATQKMLTEQSQIAYKACDQLSCYNIQPLRDLIQYNEARTH